MNDERVDIIAAAEIYGCTPLTITRRIKNGSLPAVKDWVIGRHGRRVYKIMLRREDLDTVFSPVPVGPAGREHLVREILRARDQLTGSQRARIIAALR